MSSTSTGAADRFEIDDVLSVRYSYHYGGITPFFEQLGVGSPPFRITACAACGLRYCPPRYQCSSCWAETTWIDHEGSGTVESLVWVYWIPYDSPARDWTDLPYAYAAVRLDGCANLLRTRVTGVEPSVDLAVACGRRGSLRVVVGASGRAGDLFFELDPSSVFE